ncbi:MAG TPA: hypothetical protein VGO50_07760 [Pyrinomonadaceae bacterium]|jgi:hypothetical protein|nr:hypothetical protein [Pyrinomonadaceae bacterium]
MKKTLLLSLILTGAFAVFPIANANAAENVNSVTVSESQPQWQQRQRRGRRGGDRSFIQTRTVRRGGHLYRETYRVRIHNGRTTTTLISRVRIR